MSRRALVAALCLLAGGIAGCAEERSATAYCDTYDAGFAQIKDDYPEIDQYESRDDQNPLTMLLSLTGAYGDIVALIGDMSEVAPDEIRTDTERVHETMQSSIDNAGDVLSDPLGALGGQLVAGIASSGAFERMDAFTVQHCGEHMFSAGG